ncbi:hypothetical protein ABPG72_011435 [Tetrahymena utriculariae]
MLPYIHHKRIIFDDNSQQLSAKSYQSPLFFLQNNERLNTPNKQRENKSLDKREKNKKRSHRKKSEVSSPIDQITPQIINQHLPGPGHYSIKYELVQPKAPTAKIYTEPSTINTNETLSKYLTTELINKKMLNRHKSIVDGQNLSPRPGKYSNDNYLQKKSISFKFAQQKRDESFLNAQTPKLPQNSHGNNDSPSLEFVDPKLGNQSKSRQRGNTLCELDINGMFDKSDFRLISIPTTQQNYKGRSFSRSPKKLSPRYLEDDKFINENNYDDIQNENPGPGHYQIIGHFDPKPKKNETNKLQRIKNPSQYDKKQKLLLRPLQPPRQLYSPTEAHRQEFNSYMQQLKQNLPSSQTPQLQSNREYQQISPTTGNTQNQNSQKRNYQNMQQKYLENGVHLLLPQQNYHKNQQSIKQHFIFPHDFVKYEEQIYINY